MPTIQCPGCKAYLSLTDATVCPRCSGALPTPQLAIDTARAARTRLTPKILLACLALAGIAVSGIAIIYRTFHPSDDELHRRAVMAALAKCQAMITATSAYGDAETPPAVTNYGKADEFYFAWPRGSFHFKNQFGIPVKMSASCEGTLSTSKITSLTINSKDIPL